MIYIFSFTIIYTLIREKEKIFGRKINLVIYILLSLIGVALGIIYVLNPYIPSITSMIEKNMK